MKIKISIIFGSVLTICMLNASMVKAQINASDIVKQQRHHQFTQVLKAYVDEQGMVNYPALCEDDQFTSYVESLSNTDWESLNDSDQLAFWINVYNAFTLKVICDNYPVKSINALHRGGLALGTVFNSTIWDKKFFSINDESMSLGHVEHEILRKGEEKDRIHFAIVCAAVSCPPLRQEAYEGYKIDAQLDGQGFVFLNRTDLNEFDMEKRIARLSGIFKWFLKDFGSNRIELLEFLSFYAPSEEVKESLKNDAKQWRVRWKKYDWSLNDSAQ